MTDISRALCFCGSGLRAARCCRLEKIGAPPAPEALSAETGRALAAFQAGDEVLTRRLCLEILERAPLHLEALSLFAGLLQVSGPPAAYIAVLQRVQALAPDDLAVTQELASQLLEANRLAEAEVQARNAVRLAPDQALCHLLLANVLTHADNAPAGEFHYRRVLELAPQHAATVANLAWSLKLQGRIDEARALYVEATALDPTIALTWLGWAQTEDAGRDLARAAEYLARAKQLDPDLDVAVFEAALLARQGANDAALAVLDGTVYRDAQFEALLLRGRILDRLNRHDEAFAAATAGKALVREAGHNYAEMEAANLTARLAGFFTAARLRMLPRPEAPTSGQQPLFIVGAPRSGTTLVEQILSAHPAVAAGDELRALNQVAISTPQLLGSPLAYPEALSELWMGDRRDGIEQLRDDYLRRVRRRLPSLREERFFTDKTPFNETHLGLIGLLFPAAPIVHVLRHPLDVVLSMTFNNLTHGFNCANAVETAARHLVRVFELVAHYRAEMALRYLPLRYEELVDDLEGNVRRLTDFAGLDFDERCLRFDANLRYARTASYAQVTENLYDRSVYRYRAYLHHLQPVLPILEPVIQALGYDV